MVLCKLHYRDEGLIYGAGMTLRGDAGEMRRCTWEDEGVRDHLMDFAVSRINKFIHVGATDRLSESVEAAGVSGSRSLGLSRRATGTGHKAYCCMCVTTAVCPSVAAGGDEVQNESAVLCRRCECVRIMEGDVSTWAWACDRGDLVSWPRCHAHACRRLLSCIADTA